ncbi:MAG: hypothetical protein HOG34_07730, partial [Bacteroidetes bacterium]|nr:hypothetical protein [Bacteroidota bacterium]
MRKKSLLHLLSLACLFLFLGNIQIQAQEATEKEDAGHPCDQYAGAEHIHRRLVLLCCPNRWRYRMGVQG